MPVDDPAANPLAMRRLEILVDLLLLSTFENAAERGI